MFGEYCPGLIVSSRTGECLSAEEFRFAVGLRTLVKSRLFPTSYCPGPIELEASDMTLADDTAFCVKPWRWYCEVIV